MKNRTELAKYFAELGFKNGAEVGACFGYYSKILCDNIPGLSLLAIDSWENQENARRERTRNKSGEQATRELLEPYNAIILKSDSVEASEGIEDESLDFVFIDADHTYEGVKRDIEAWAPKVRPGGIVSGHDYYVFASGEDGVIRAVDEYVKTNGIKLLTTEWDKKNPARDDRQPCWYFIKV